MITIITGIPGHGKTLYAVSRFAEFAKQEGRQVFFAGIPDCSVPGWLPVPGGNEFADGSVNYTDEALTAARSWHQFPPRSIVVVDEAHQVFPQRGPSAVVPEYVGMTAVLRRLGIDLVLITQDGNSLDHFVRRRCGRYLHIWRSMGMARATVWEFPRCCDWEDHNARRLGRSSQWAYPKGAYALYKSAEVHTVKMRLPKALLWLPVGVAALGFCGFLAYKALFGGLGEAPSKALEKAKAPVAAATSPSTPPQAGPVKTSLQGPGEWLHARVPRFADFPESAPLFDTLAKPLQFPHVAVCMRSGGKCSCYSQQGTRLGSGSAEYCERFVAEGSFNPYLRESSGSRGMGGSPPMQSQQAAANEPVVAFARSPSVPPSPSAEPNLTLSESGEGRAHARPRGRP